MEQLAIEQAITGALATLTRMRPLTVCATSGIGGSRWSGGAHVVMLLAALAHHRSSPHAHLVAIALPPERDVAIHRVVDSWVSRFRGDGVAFTLLADS